jgi:hypothetical protein
MSINKYSIVKRRGILRKILYRIKIRYAVKESRTKDGANKYAFQYLWDHPDAFVLVSNVQDYSSEQSKLIRGKPLGDPSRAFEILRKDKLPSQWLEVTIKGRKYVKYFPELKETYNSEIYNSQINRKDSFPKDLIDAKLNECNRKCAITGLPESEGKLAADHWNPKEKGGLSEPKNCVILNKHLNEKKNNMTPVEWFIGLVTNFINVCISTGMDKEKVKADLIQMIMKI